MISTLFLLVVGTLEVAGIIKETGLALEYFGISAALYFGRSLNFGGKSFEAKEEEKSLTTPKE